MSTYGNYSKAKIRKVCCAICAVVIADYHLQLLLDQKRTLCPTCQAAQPKEITEYGTVESRAGAEDLLQRMETIERLDHQRNQKARPKAGRTAGKPLANHARKKLKRPLLAAGKRGR